MEEMRRTERLRPDILLKKVNRESRGKLTVFLGAAAGVGNKLKTATSKTALKKHYKKTKKALLKTVQIQADWGKMEKR